VNSEFQYVHECLEHFRGLCPALQSQLTEAGETLLDADHAPAVGEGARGIAIGHAACHLVGREEAEPDQQLIAEIRVTTREQAPSGCNGGSHDLRILNVADAVRNPPHVALSAYLRH